jgi:hypothetical protein
MENRRYFVVFTQLTVCLLQIGDGTTEIKPSPVAVFGLASGSGVLSFSVSDGISCAVVTGGLLKCWGGNSCGRVRELLSAESIILSAHLLLFHTAGYYTDLWAPEIILRRHHFPKCRHPYRCHWIE